MGFTIVGEKMISLYNQDIIDVNQIQNVLYKKQNKLNKIIDTYIDSIKINSYIESTKKNSLFFNNPLNKLDNKEFIVLIFRNDSIKYWTDNSITIPHRYSNSDLLSPVVELNNGWYILNSKKFKNINIVGLVLLKHKYSIQNKYLENLFQEKFGIPSSIKISMIPLSHSFDILDKQNNYLFSLAPSSDNTEHLDYPYFFGILNFIALLLIILYIHQKFIEISLSKKSNLWLVLIFIILIFVRYLMIKYKLPSHLYLLPIFEPEHFAVTLWYSSLGDFLINSIIILFFSKNIFIAIRPGKISRFLFRKPKNISYIIIFIFIIFSFVLYEYINSLLKSLIYNSSISFSAYKILDIDLFSFIGFIIIALLISSFIIFLDNLILFIKKHASIKVYIIIFLKSFVIIILSVVISNYDMPILSFGYIAAIFIIISVIRYRNIKFQYYSYILLILVTSIFLAIFIYTNTNAKEIEKRKILVSSLANERDLIAEHILSDIELSIPNDESIESYIQRQSSHQLSDISNHMMRRYINGYMEKYELDVSICAKSEKLEKIAVYENCVNNKKQLIEKYGIPIDNSNYYFLDNLSGSISYLGIHDFISEKNDSIIKLYFSLNSKLISQELGYPDLLLDTKIDKISPLSNYSYAKYRNNKLVMRSGNFSYNLTNKAFKTSSSGYSFINYDFYDHTIYNINENNSIILSSPQISKIDLVISFSYIFVFFSLIMSLILIIVNIKGLLKELRLNFRSKLQFSMVLILLLSFLTIGSVTLYFTMEQYSTKHEQTIREKLESLVTELEQKLGNETSLNANWKTNKYLHLDELLSKFSFVFFSDINLYDLKGNLLATSRPEVFNSGLIGKKINHIAFRQLVVNHKAKFIHNENIGKLNYSSAYVMFNNNDNKPLAYINLPYFTKPSVLREELSNLIVTFVNLYVFLLLVAIVTAVAMSTRIMQPLQVIQNSFKEIEIGKTNKPIVYNSDDEIGGLVKEYNRMVKELANSAKLLGKSERESAWREMAKQIAHEIKNPLTPMKLSVQFLQRSWQNNDENFSLRLDRVCKTLIEQINTLSAIATEFSAFAKMPKAHNEEVNIISKIENTVQLFSNTENITIITKLNNHKQLNIVADKEQISRVFINLIKNSIQAVPTDVKGVIEIEVTINNNKVLVKIEDNGTGISEDQKEKLFTPSFTTKTSGMGMGLPIVKNIIENANGTIWFETELKKGTKFFVEFSLKKYDS